jgi:heat-inducible transcriptional repressor
MSLEAREEQVIAIVVRAYIESASPVGSRYVAKHSNLNLSPATIRNIMADLTEKGYLMQPYTSAGRIPTDKAFRFYVDYVLKPSLPSEDTQREFKEYIANAGLNLSDILEQTSKLISSQASQVGMAVAPQKECVRWRQIDLILVRPGLVMAILVYQGGIVQNTLLTVDKKMTSDDLIRYGNYLNEKFQGRTMLEVRHQLLREMELAQKEFNALYAKALSIAQAAFAQKDNREIFVEGKLYVLNQLDGKDISSMRDILEFLERNSDLLELLDKISQSKELTVTFGTEIFGPELGEWGIIASPYRVRGKPLGIIGTIGPIHMDYSRLVPMVDCVAKMLSEILETRF